MKEDSPQLIERIKLLSFRTKQLEGEKKIIFSQLKSDQETNEKKLSTLLKEVKGIKMEHKNSVSHISRST